MKRSLIRLIVVGETLEKEQEITLDDLSKALTIGGFDVEPVFSNGNPPYLFVSRKKQLAEVKEFKKE